MHEVFLRPEEEVKERDMRTLQELEEAWNTVNAAMDCTPSQLFPNPDAIALGDEYTRLQQEMKERGYVSVLNDNDEEIYNGRRHLLLQQGISENQ